MKTSMLKFALAFLCVSMFAISAYATSCGVNPDQPQCAPGFDVTWKLQGSNQTHNAVTSGPMWTGSFWQVNFQPQATNGFQFTFGQLKTDPTDPFVSYSFGVINTSGKNTTFTFDFTTPYAGPPIFKEETTFTDALQYIVKNNGSATVAPTGTFLQTSLVNGSALPNFELGKGCTATFNSPCSSAGPFDVLDFISLPGSGTLEITGQFVVSNNGSYSIQGETDLTPSVPEPGTLALLGSGVVGIAAMLRRRFLV